MKKIRLHYEAITKGLRSNAEGTGVRNYTLTKAKKVWDDMLTI